MLSTGKIIRRHRTTALDVVPGPTPRATGVHRYPAVVVQNVP